MKLIGQNLPHLWTLIVFMASPGFFGNNKLGKLIV